MKHLLVVYDANILIDFCKLNLVHALFLLDYDFRTVDAVWDELRIEQQEIYLSYIEIGRFKIEKIEEVEMIDVIAVRMSRKQLSFPDCTALIYAKNRQGILLTSDKNLRLTASLNQVSVCGHLWVFDELFVIGVMTGKELSEKLSELCEVVNPRLGLPEEECKKRRTKWIY